MSPIARSTASEAIGMISDVGSLVILVALKRTFCMFKKNPVKFISNSVRCRAL